MLMRCDSVDYGAHWGSFSITWGGGGRSIAVTEALSAQRDLGHSSKRKTGTVKLNWFPGEG